MAPPVLRLVSPTYTYNLLAEGWISSGEVRGWVIKSQVPPDTYDLELVNPDGQVGVAPDAIVVP